MTPHEAGRIRPPVVFVPASFARTYLVLVPYAPGVLAPIGLPKCNYSPPGLQGCLLVHPCGAFQAEPAPPTGDQVYHVVRAGFGVRKFHHYCHAVDVIALPRVSGYLLGQYFGLVDLYLMRAKHAIVWIRFYLSLKSAFTLACHYSLDKNVPRSKMSARSRGSNSETHQSGGHGTV